MNANVATMQVATTRNFGDLEIQVYENPDVAHNRAQDDFWMTRDQIGTALGYEKPNDSIRMIHKRNKDRLDPLSTSNKVFGVEGKRTVMREVVCYSLRGVMEICRYSTQPKANAFMDFCWDVITALMRGETVSLKSMEAQKQAEVAARRQANFEVLNNGFRDLSENQQLLYAQYEELSKYRAEDRQAVENVLNYNRTLIGLVNRIIDKTDMALQGIQKLIPSEEKGEPVQYTRYEAPESETSWHHDVKIMISAIAKAKNSDSGHVRGWFHNILKNEYGWSVYEERKKYAKEHNIDDIQSIPLGVVVEADPVCRRIFFNKVADEYEVCTGKHIEHMKEPTKKPPLIPLDAIPVRHPVVDPAPEVVAEAYAVEVETEMPELEKPAVETPVVEQPKKKAYHYKPSITLPIVEPIAKKLGDKTIGYRITYAKIYNVIGITKMDRMRKAYIRTHNRPPKCTPEIFQYSDKNMKVFKEAAKAVAAII